MVRTDAIHLYDWISFLLLPALFVIRQDLLRLALVSLEQNHAPRRGFPTGRNQERLAEEDQLIVELVGLHAVADVAGRNQIQIIVLSPLGTGAEVIDRLGLLSAEVAGLAQDPRTPAVSDRRPSVPRPCAYVSAVPSGSLRV